MGVVSNIRLHEKRNRDIDETALLLFYRQHETHAIHFKYTLFDGLEKECFPEQAKPNRERSDIAQYRPEIELDKYSLEGGQMVVY